MELVVCNSKSARTRGAASGFPNDVIEEILSRLDAQSVMRCKCVCKSWLSLITHPSFKHRHLKNQVPGALLRAGNLSRAFSFHVNDNGNHRFWSHPFPNDYMNHPVVMENLNLNVIVFGCENGVICFSYGNVVYLWNPAIRKMKKFLSPSPPSPCPMRHLYGLGYHTLTDDFKVVGIPPMKTGGVGFYFDNNFKKGNLVGVYSLRGPSSWKTLEMPDLFFSDPNCANHQTAFCSFVLNGFIHWLVYYGREIEETVLESLGIVAFDMSTEVFKLINSPPSLRGLEAYTAIRMFDLSGCLSLLTFKRPGLIDMWVMKEYGVSDSWTKHFSLNLSKSFVPFPTDYDFMYPLGRYSNGDLLLHGGDVFYLYNSKCNRVEYLCPGFFVMQFATYVESVFLS
ncbi:F-box domain containing protein [Trema orientale]|uniref:F-box domain containing protein n=1 Tax=Trema orientale TaxID=63057 RepID=A0A2P5CCJ7_TREOI|nr:F-box domain containing protein [Trema orientale]